MDGEWARVQTHSPSINYWNPEMSANIDRKCTIIKYWKAKCTKKEMDGIFDERFLI